METTVLYSKREPNAGGLGTQKKRRSEERRRREAREERRGEERKRGDGDRSALFKTRTQRRRVGKTCVSTRVGNERKPVTVGISG